MTLFKGGNKDAENFKEFWILPSTACKISSKGSEIRKKKTPHVKRRRRKKDKNILTFNPCDTTR